jgi:putative ABC transport system permease protein
MRTSAALSFLDLRVRPLQSILTALAIFLSVTAFLGAIVSTSVARDVFVASAEQQDGRRSTVSAPVVLPSLGDDYLASTSERTERTAILHDASWYASSARRGVVTRTVDDGLYTSSAEVVLYLGHPDDVKRLPLTDGAWPTDVDRAPFPPRAVVNQELARRLGIGSVTGQPTAALSSGHISSEDRVVVAGVVNDGIEDPVAYVPMVPAVARGTTLPASSTVTFSFHSPSRTRAELSRLFRPAVLGPGTTLDSPPSRTDTVDELSDDLGTQTTVLRGLTLLLLIVSTVGVLNVGLSNVRERSREFHIRRAMGSRRSDIFLLVMLGSWWTAMLSALAGGVVVAVGMALVKSQLAASGSPIEAPSFPLSVLGMAAALGVASAVVGAATPSYLASKADIADALRD